jgi:hypothetical protein
VKDVLQTYYRRVQGCSFERCIAEPLATAAGAAAAAALAAAAAVRFMAQPVRVEVRSASPPPQVVRAERGGAVTERVTEEAERGEHRRSAKARACLAERRTVCACEHARAAQSSSCSVWPACVS